MDKFNSFAIDFSIQFYLIIKNPSILTSNSDSCAALERDKWNKKNLNFQVTRTADRDGF